MPTYEFKCKDCGAEFEVDLSLSEQELEKREHMVKCTACGRTNLEQEVSFVQVQTERKSA
jgi:putative FmdB family regulatory protein